MSFTKVYKFQNLKGYESVISKGNSEMTHMGFARILLDAGESLEYDVVGQEQAIVLQSGDFTAWVEYQGKTVLGGVSGTRGSVYDDLPTALYVPPQGQGEDHQQERHGGPGVHRLLRGGQRPLLLPPGKRGRGRARRVHL